MPVTLKKALHVVAGILALSLLSPTSVLAQPTPPQSGVLSEVHRTWNRPEAAQIGALYAHVSPNYAAVVESYNKAQDVAKQQSTGSTGQAAKQ